MIEVTTIFQSRKFLSEEFGFGNFGWTPIARSDLDYIIDRVAKSDIQIEVIGIKEHRKYFTGLWKSKNIWTKSQGGSKSVFFDPVGRDDSITAISNSIISTAMEVTGGINPTLNIETSVLNAIQSNIGVEGKSISKIKIICNN